MDGDLEMIGHAVNSETIVESVRGPLIPGFVAVKKAAINAGIKKVPFKTRNFLGAFGCTISGAGPTIFAVVEDAVSGKVVSDSMCHAFQSAGGLNIQRAQIVNVDNKGARTLK